MELLSESFGEGDPIPAEYAFGVPDPDSHVSFAPNRNPHLRWTDPPEGAQSFAIIFKATKSLNMLAMQFV